MASLIRDLKSELALVSIKDYTLRKAELAALARLSASFHTHNKSVFLDYRIDNEILVRKVQRDFLDCFGLMCEVHPIPGTHTSKTPQQYRVRVLGSGTIIARQLGLLDTRSFPVIGLPHMLTTGSKDISVSVWRSAIFASGNISELSKPALLEVSCNNPIVASAISGAATRIGVVNKIREARSGRKVVLKDPASIEFLLKSMGSVDVVDRWSVDRRERNEREYRGVANRLANFDDANIRRSAEASVVICAKVARALEILGDTIPEHLEDAARLRLEHKNASLDELRLLSSENLSKDAFAGRIRRLLRTADKRALELGIPDTSSGIPQNLV